MIPAGYMAKRITAKPDWLKADNVRDIYSVSDCISENFTDYINYWKHNGFWLFNSPQIIKTLSEENSISLDGAKYFYYEVYELEYHNNKPNWHNFTPDYPVPVNVIVPEIKTLEGYDIVTFSGGSAPECSPLSCNGLAVDIRTNSHCLIDTFEDAKQNLENGMFMKGEPGPHRIFAVYSIE